MNKPESRLKVWWVAARPFAVSGSVLPVLLGMALAHVAGYPVRWLCFALTLGGVVCFQTAANLLNDCFDFRRGLDSEVHPGSGAVVRGWLTDKQALRAGLAVFAVGVFMGLILVWLAGWPVLWIGLIGAVLVLGYTRTGLCLKYAGLGDFAIFAAFGVLPVLGTYWVQTRTFSWIPVLWSIPLVSLTVGILHANNWRDLSSDSDQFCRTLATRLGEDGSRSSYRMLVLGPFVLVCLYVVLGLAGIPLVAPPLTLVAMLAVPPALRLARTDRTHHAERFAALDVGTAQLQLLVGVLLVVALFAARHLPGA